MPYGDKFGTVRNLPLSALYELAAPKTPLEVREEVEKMIEAGEVVTKATVQVAAFRSSQAFRASEARASAAAVASVINSR